MHTHNTLLVSLPSSRLITGLLCVQLLWLPGCETTFAPQRLASYTEDVTTVRTEPTEEPEIQLTPHSDGLGWTAHVIVSERVHQNVNIQEVWEGRQLKIPFDPIVVEIFGLLCPLGIMGGMFGGGFMRDAVTPSWIYGFQMCAGGADAQRTYHTGA